MSKKQKDFANRLRSRGLVFNEEVRALPGTPDIYFDNNSLAVFFNGCFWHNHGCGKPIKNVIVASQRATQAEIDRAQYRELLRLNLNYVVVWECDFDKDPEAQVDKVIDRLRFS